MIFAVSLAPIFMYLQTCFRIQIFNYSGSEMIWIRLLTFKQKTLKKVVFVKIFLSGQILSKNTRNNTRNSEKFNEVNFFEHVSANNLILRLFHIH